MTDEQAIVEEAIRRGGFPRLRHLALEHPDAPTRLHFMEKARRIAAGERVVFLPRPSYFKMACSFLRSMLEWAKDGFRLVTETQARQRHAICGGCESFDRKQKVCRECGCGVQGVVALKPYLRSARCPKDKWPEPQ